MAFVLRENQTDVLWKIADAYKAGKRSILVQAPTGFGKTVLAVRIINGALNKPRKLPDGGTRLQQIAMCVPSISLINQTFDKMLANDIREIGVIQADNPRTNLFMPVQICSVATLNKRGMLSEFDLVLIDETHIWFKYYEKWITRLLENPSTLVIGLSATPWTRSLGKWYQEHVVAATLSELIGCGDLAPFRVYNSPRHIKPDLSQVGMVAGEYNEGELSVVMQEDPLIADAVQTWKDLAQKRPTLVFCVDRAHAAKVASAYNAAGIRAGYIDMYTPTDPAEGETRDEIGQKLKRGELDVVCNVDCLTIGVDWPWVSCVQLCRPTKSEMRYVQIIGRGLRTDDGKDDCLILDHSVTTENLGFVDDCYDRMTAAGLNEGKKDKDATRPKKETLPKECGVCGMLRPPKAKKCPGCGFEPEPQSEVEFVSGELKEAVRDKKHKRANLPLDERQRWWSSLLAIAQERKYSKGWTFHKYKEWTGGIGPGNDMNQQLAATEAHYDVVSWVRSRNIAWAKSKNNNVRNQGTLPVA